jgi:hypothetical protein
MVNQTVWSWQGQGRCPDADSSVWEKSKQLYAWTHEHHAIALENVFDYDEVCLCYCGHIGGPKHKQAVHGRLADVRHLG